jgi:predicted acyltransferase
VSSSGRTGDRLLSLDVFRGLTMAAMVVVNNPGDWEAYYWPLGHAPWEGWTPTDLIFPFFLFIVGIAITLSRRSVAPGAIVRRALLIVALGLLLSGFPAYDFETIRVPGVLQRIGVCYLAAAFAYRWARSASPDAGAWRVGARLLGLAGVALVGYWLLLLAVPGAAGRRFDLTPEGNVGAIVDRAIFGRHLWKGTWDPEGLLSTVPSIGTTLLGAVAGEWIRIAGADRRRLVNGLLHGGLAMALTGAAWSLQFPIIKNLWTSSYAVFTAGVASMALAGCCWMVDVRGWRRWTRPFEVLGVNAIALFMVSGLLTRLLLVVRIPTASGTPVPVRSWLYRTWFEPLAAPVNASLFFALANLAGLYLLLWWMYRRGLVIKV